MSKTRCAVLAAPHGGFPEGEILTQRQLPPLEAADAPLVLVDLDLVMAGGAGAGYVRRSWGRDGLLVDATKQPATSRLAPLAMRVLPGVNHFSWIARLGHVRGVLPDGVLRLAVDTREQGNQEPLKTVAAALLEGWPFDDSETPSDEGLFGPGRLVRGDAQLVSDSSRFVSLCLQAGPTTRGVRVQWLAVGQRVEQVPVRP